VSVWWPFALYVVLVVGQMLGMLGLSFVFGESRRPRTADIPYESGMLPGGPIRTRRSAWFWLIGVFFVMFDLEAAWLYAWAVVVRDTGWVGWVEVALFASLLLLGLFYVWKNGALDIGSAKRQLQTRTTSPLGAILVPAPPAIQPPPSTKAEPPSVAPAIPNEILGGTAGPSGGVA
jgi:NADH-quinone oxidoreductase subunit A